jgi:hypothetical protein
MFAFAYVVGMFVSTGAVIYLAHRKMRVADDGTWTADTITLARDVRAATDYEDFDEVQRRLVPLASRLDGHLRAAPPDADDRLRGLVRDLSVECRSVGMEHPYRTSSDALTRKLEALDETARAVQQAASESAA